MSPIEVQANVTSGDDSPAWAIRLEAKVDVALAQQGARLMAMETHIATIDRDVQVIQNLIPEDAKARLREVESRRTISAQQLWTAVVSGVGLIGAASTALTILVK